MGQTFETTDPRQHRENRFDTHAVIPFASLTDSQIGRMPALPDKMPVAKHHHLVSDPINQALKSAAIVDISRITSPVHHQAEMIDQQTQLATDNPALVGIALPSNLTPTAPLSPRMDQFNAKAVNQPQHGWRRQKARQMNLLLL